MHTAFAVALEDLTGVRTFIRFGENTPIKDIHAVLDEEVEASKGMKILGFGFLDAKSEKKLMEVYAKWKEHFDK